MSLYAPKTKNELIRLIENPNIKLSDIDVGFITDMSGLFYRVNRADFSGIESWDVSNVVDMSLMFYGCDIFDEDIGGWKLDKLRFANRMFEGAISFSKDISGWNMRNVATAWAFVGCKKLGYKQRPKNIEKLYRPQSLNELKTLVSDEKIGLFDIDTSQVDDFSYLFLNSDRSDFSGIESWDVSNVKSFVGTFEGAKSFNENIGAWKIGSNSQQSGDGDGNANDAQSVNLTAMFKNASSFNQDLSQWDVSGLEHFASMFEGAKKFNQDLSSWDMSAARTLKNMFCGALNFNADISRWSVNSVKSFNGMFKDAISFNQDLSGWDVSGGEDFGEMFKNAKQFKCDLSGWEVSEEANTQEAFEDTIMKKHLCFGEKNDAISIAITNKDQADRKIAEPSDDGDGIVNSSESETQNSEIKIEALQKELGELSPSEIKIFMTGVNVGLNKENIVLQIKESRKDKKAVAALRAKQSGDGDGAKKSKEAKKPSQQNPLNPPHNNKSQNGNEIAGDVITISINNPNAIQINKDDRKE